MVLNTNEFTSFFLILIVILPIANGLKCYQCVTLDKTPCNETYLRDCPTDQAYDECSILYKKTGKLI